MDGSHNSNSGHISFLNPQPILYSLMACKTNSIAKLINQPLNIVIFSSSLRHTSLELGGVLSSTFIRPLFCTLQFLKLKVVPFPPFLLSFVYLFIRDSCSFYLSLLWDYEVLLPFELPFSKHLPTDASG